MDKKKLISQVAQKSGLKSNVAAVAVEAVFETLVEAIEKSEKITLHGFGSFTVKKRAERKGVNPSTKEAMTITSKNIVKFKQSRNIDV